MKKLLIILSIIFLMGMSYSPFSKYNIYLGKQIKVTTLSKVYIGNLDAILTIDNCGQRDMYGGCLYREYYHTLIVNVNDQRIFISEESVVELEELNAK